MLLKWIYTRGLRDRIIGAATGLPFAGGPIGTPCPPSGAALAVVKLLPLALLIVGVHRGTTVDPHGTGFGGGFAAGGTGKTHGVDGWLGPIGRGRVKGFHCEEEEWI